MTPTSTRRALRVLLLAALAPASSACTSRTPLDIPPTVPESCTSNAGCAEACVGGVCVAYVASGGVCDEPADCAAGLDCVAGVCGGSAPTSCTVNTECPAVCIQGTCAPVASQGGACDEPADCQAGLMCVSDVCVVPAPVCGNGVRETGEACDDGDTDPCTGACNADCSGPGNVCGDGVIACGETCEHSGSCTVDCNATCSGTSNTMKTEDLFGDASAIVTYRFDYDFKSLIQVVGSYGAYDAVPVGSPSIVAGLYDGAARLTTGDALRIDGVPLPAAASARAVSLWVSFDSAAGPQSILSYGNPTGTAGQWFSLGVLASGALGFETNGATLSSGVVATTGRWYHLALSYDGTTLSLFVDGALAASQAMTLDTTTVEAKLLGDDSGARSLRGRVDQVRVFSRALLASEVVRLAGECASPDPLEGQVFGTLAYEETFGGDLSAWNLWGSPLPQILADAGAANGFAFDSNGDGTWESGADCTALVLDAAQAFAVEYRAKQPHDADVANKWLFIDLGITHTLSSGDGSTAAAPLAHFEISGVSDTNSWYLLAPFALRFRVAGSPTINLDYWNDEAYHVYRLETALQGGMRYVRFLVDGMLYESGVWADASTSPWYVALRGRSSGTFNNYVDWVRVYTP